jgi:hypothetical protein
MEEIKELQNGYYLELGPGIRGRGRKWKKANYS